MDSEHLHPVNKHGSLLFSVLIHAALIVAAYIAGRRVVDTMPGSGTGGTGSGYYAIEEYLQQNREPVAMPEQTVPVDPLNPAGETIPTEGAAASQQGTQGKKNTGHPGAGGFFGGADTSGLRGVYSEQSLGVTIRYPAGWQFMDQQRKNKLDGVTFLGLPTSRGDVPYVFINVQEKYLFNPARYTIKEKTDRYEIYYNDPIVLEGQYTQVFYMLTEGGEDYSIKLIVKGKESFQEFQPVFLGMIKTFAFR